MTVPTQFDGPKAQGPSTPRNATLCDGTRREKCRIDETNPPPGGRSSLSPRQLSAAALLLSGKTARATARALGVNVCSIFRWKRLPVFQMEITRRAGLIGTTCAPSPRAEPRNEFLEKLLAEIEGRRPTLERAVLQRNATLKGQTDESNPPRAGGNWSF